MTGMREGSNECSMTVLCLDSMFRRMVTTKFSKMVHLPVASFVIIML
jgi:hypothetical protein